MKELLVIVLLVVLLLPVAEHLTKMLIAVWGFYDAYVRLWTLNGVSVLGVQISLCAIVGSLYLRLLQAYSRPGKKRRDREYSFHHMNITGKFPDLRALMPAFEQFITMERFLPVAFQNRLLSMEEMERVQGAKGRAMQVAHLIDLLERKGPHCVTRVISCFEMHREEFMGHAELADILQRALERQKAEHCTEETTGIQDINAVRLENDIDDLARRLRTDTETLTSLTEKLRQRRSSEYCQT